MNAYVDGSVGSNCARSRRIKDVRAKILISNIDFFLKILPLKVEELVISEVSKKIGSHQLRLGENMPERTPKAE